MTLTLVLSLMALPLQADIYSYVDSNGVRHITNDPKGDTRYQRVMSTPQYQRPATPAPTPEPAAAEQPETVLAAAAAGNGIVTTSTGGWQLITPRNGRAVISRSAPGGAAAGRGAPFRINETNRQLYSPHITRIAARHGVDPYLIHAVISAESAFNPKAVSSAGAMGLMQLMPATAMRFGVENSLSPRQNIAGGVKYLDWLMGEFDSDPLLALAGYNAGEGAVRSHAGVPPYSETRDYVPKVLAAFRVARGLCMTPPVLASDGCVFAALN